VPCVSVAAANNSNAKVLVSCIGKVTISFFKQLVKCLYFFDKVLEESSISLMRSYAVGTPLARSFRTSPGHCVNVATKVAVFYLFGPRVSD
jgi:hypothetical protein